MSEEKKGLVIGLSRPASLAQVERFTRQAEEALPDFKVVFIEGVSSVTPLDTEADLIVAATRMHEALYREGEWLNNGPVEVVSAFDQLQKAMRRRGWES